MDLGRPRCRLQTGFPLFSVNQSVTTGTYMQLTAFPLLTPEEAASQLQVSPRHLFNLRKRGLIKFVKVGKLVRFRPQDIQDAVANLVR